jgi:hypothetical protein
MENEIWITSMNFLMVKVEIAIVCLNCCCGTFVVKYCV